MPANNQAEWPGRTTLGLGGSSKGKQFRTSRKRDLDRIEHPLYNSYTSLTGKNHR